MARFCIKVYCDLLCIHEKTVPGKVAVNVCKEEATKSLAFWIKASP